MSNTLLILPGDYLKAAPPRISGTEGEYDIQHTCPPRQDRDLLNRRILARAGMTVYGDHHSGAAYHWLLNGGNMHIDGGCLEYSSPEAADAYAEAAGNFAGMLLVRRLCAVHTKPVAAYRHAGTCKVDLVTGQSRTITLGYHENRMIPRAAVDDDLPGILDSFDATRIWAWGGMVGDDGYELSQKANGIGRRSGTGTRSPTTEGEKPMGWIKINDADTLSGAAQEVYCRSERRAVDVGYSRVAAFVSAAMGSGVLRITEHRSKLGSRHPIGRLMFTDPVCTLKQVSRDLTLRNAYPTNDSEKTLSAINMQEYANECLTHIGERVELPEGEVAGLALHREMCSRLGRLDLLGGDLSAGRGWFDFTARLAFLTRRDPILMLHCRNPRALQRSLAWSRFAPEGKGAAYWRRLYETGKAPDPLGDALIAHYAQYPPHDTRASIRGGMVRSERYRNRLLGLGWIGAKLRTANGEHTHIRIDPFQAKHPELSLRRRGGLPPRIAPQPQLPQ